MPLGRALRILGNRAVDFKTAVAMALDGRLRVAARDPMAVGLQRFLIDVEGTTDRGKRSVSAVAERLGLKWQVAAHLVARGLVDLTPSGADLFRTTYIGGGELARIRETSSKALLAVMAAEGHSPVTGPSVDGGRQYFYRRIVVASRDWPEGS